MGRFVIVAYTPKAGKEAELLAAVRKHLGVLRAERLVTDKPACVMRAGKGAIIGVFEWRSAAAIEKAHSSEAVQALWDEFSLVCDFTPLITLAEAEQIFAEFEAIDL